MDKKYIYEIFLTGSACYRSLIHSYVVVLIWLALVKINGLYWIKLDQLGSNWINLDQIGSNWVKCKGPKSQKITQPVWTLFLFKSIWTPSQGSQRFTNKTVELPQKGTNFEKSSKLKKKCQKNLVFLEYFEYSSFWGQY
jgi:hypothetical protein